MEAACMRLVGAPRGGFQALALTCVASLARTAGAGRGGEESWAGRRLISFLDKLVFEIVF